MMAAIMKTSGMILIVVCTTSLGLSMAKTLWNRVQELEAAFSALTALEGELRYTLAPPDEAVMRLESRESLAKAAFLPACASFCRQGMPFPKAWLRAVSEATGDMHPDDLDILSSLSDVLGQCDIQSQLTQLAGARERLGVQLEQARAKAASHAKLYRTMGVLAGAFIVVVLV